MVVDQPSEDCWPGWFYVFQRTLAEMLLSLKLLERKMGARRRETGV